MDENEQIKISRELLEEALIWIEWAAKQHPDQASRTSGKILYDNIYKVTFPSAV